MRDGAVTMGHCYGMEELEMYWWLTSKKWYPPNLPEEMPTAYVVKAAKKEVFEAQFTGDDDVNLKFENARFAVYVSSRNHVQMQ